MIKIVLKKQNDDFMGVGDNYLMIIRNARGADCGSHPDQVKNLVFE